MEALLAALSEPSRGRRWVAAPAVVALGVAAIVVLGGRDVEPPARVARAHHVPPLRAGSTRYEAELGLRLGGARFNTNHTGASALGFVDKLTAIGAGAQFGIYASSPGTKRLTIRYGDGGTIAKTASIYVNGTRSSRIVMPTLPDWDTWGDVEIDVSLRSGLNRILIRRDAEDTGGFNLDYIELRLDVPATHTPSEAQLPGAAPDSAP